MNVHRNDEHIISKRNFRFFLPPVVFWSRSRIIPCVCNQKLLRSKTFMPAIPPKKTWLLSARSSSKVGFEPTAITDRSVSSR